MSLSAVDLAARWEQLSPMPRAVLSYYAERYGRDEIGVLKVILMHVESMGERSLGSGLAGVPAWLREFTLTPEWDLVRFTAHRTGRGLGDTFQEMLEAFAAGDPRFDASDFEAWKAQSESAPQSRQLLRYYAVRSGQDELKSMRFLIALFSRHDPEFVQADFRNFCKVAALADVEVDGGAANGAAAAASPPWGDPHLVETAIRRFAEEDRSFCRVVFRRWLEDVYCLRPGAGETLSGFIAQVERWSGLHVSGRKLRAYGGCPFADSMADPVRDYQDLVSIYDMYDDSNRAPLQERRDDRIVGVVEAKFRPMWPDDSAFRAFIPCEGIFSDESAEYSALLRFSLRFGAGALGLKVHDDKYTLHDFLFLTTKTIENNPVKLIGSAAGNSEIAKADLLLQPYYSISPYSWGQHQAVKFRLRPKDGCDAQGLLPDKWLESYQAQMAACVDAESTAASLLSLLVEHATAAVVLELSIQYSTHPDICPIDNTLVEWTSPFVKVAEVELGPAGFRGEESEYAGPRLRFNPSNVSSAEHLPLGRLNRFRRDVYDYVAKGREREMLPYRKPRNQRVAIVGGGAAGLSCAMALAEFGYEVTIFEKQAALGGHACTKEVLGGRFLRDPAFGAVRRAQWPNVWAIFEQLGVEPLSHGQADDWFDSPFAGWFDPEGNAITPSDSVLEEGQRFVGEFFRAVGEPEADGQTVGELIARLELSEEFVATFFLGGVIHYFAGQPLQAYLDYPLRLIAWMWLNNGHRDKDEPIELFHVDNRDYIERFRRFLESKGVSFSMGSKVRVLERSEHGVVLEVDRGDAELVLHSFGYAVFATPPHQSLRLLGDAAREAERAVLSQFEFTRDVVVVHEEPTGMPQDKSKWKLFNVLLPRRGSPWPKASETVPIVINLPCTRDRKTPVLATYNYAAAREWAGKGDKFSFEHAVVTPQTQRLRQQLEGLQGGQRVYFCGSWSRGLALHEDAVVSGFEVANRILGPKRSYRILQPPLAQPKPFQALASVENEDESGFDNSMEGVLKQLSEILKVVVEDVPATIEPHMEMKSLGMSSLHFARLANSLNARLGARAEVEVDILFLLQIETVGQLADYVVSLLGGHERAPSAVTDADDEKSAQSGAAPKDSSSSRRDYLGQVPRSQEATRSAGAVLFWQGCWGVALCTAIAAALMGGYSVADSLLAYGGKGLLALGAPLVWLGVVAVYSVVAVAIKWLVVGRCRPGAYPIYGATHLCWWAANLFLETGQQFFWFPFEGSSLSKLLLRMLGGHVHAGATVCAGGMRGPVSYVDADLLTIDDGAYLRPGALIQCHVFAEGHLVLGPVTIGSGASIWSRALVEPGASVEEFGILEAHSVLTLGSRLPSGECFAGVPAGFRTKHLSRGVSRPPQGSPDSLHTWMGLALFPYMACLATIAFFWFAGVIGANFRWESWSWWTCFAVWPALIFSTSSLALVTTVLKWVIVGRLVPKRSENEVAFRLAVVKFMSAQVSRAAMFWPADLRWLWLRGMGAKVAYQSVRDVPFMDFSYADLFKVEKDCFFSLAAAADFVTLVDGDPRLESVELCKRSYVGAYSTVCGPLRLPERTVLASASVLPESRVLREAEVWVGGPASRVPLKTEQSVQPFASSGATLVRDRLFEWTSQFLTVSLMSIGSSVALRWDLHGWLVSVASGTGWGGAIGVSGAILAGYAGCMVALIPMVALEGRLLKRLCGVRPGSAAQGFSRDSVVAVVWQILTNHLMVYSFLTDLLAGTSVHRGLARLLGAEIGRNAYLANGAAIREFSFTSIEQGACLNRGAALIAHSEQPDGTITLKPLRVGAQSTMGFYSYLVGGTDLPAGSILGSLSRPFDEQELEPYNEYNNTPCRKM